MRTLCELRSDLASLTSINCNSTIGLEHLLLSFNALAETINNHIQLERASLAATRSMGRTPFVDNSQPLLDLYAATLVRRNFVEDKLKETETIIVLFHAPRGCTRCRNAEAPYFIVENDRYGADQVESQSCPKCLTAAESEALVQDANGVMPPAILVMSENEFEAHWKAKCPVICWDAPEVPAVEADDPGGPAELPLEALPDPELLTFEHLVAEVMTRLVMARYETRSIATLITLSQDVLGKRCVYHGGTVNRFKLSEWQADQPPEWVPYSSLIGDLIPIEDFLSQCGNMFTDDDGHGRPLKAMPDGSFMIPSKCTEIYPSNIDERPEGVTHIMWFNK